MVLNNVVHDKITELYIEDIDIVIIVQRTEIIVWIFFFSLYILPIIIDRV